MHNINVTPLTDVLLVLLITFLLSATSFQEASSLTPLPRVAEAREVSETMTPIAVGQDGTVEWPGVEYTRGTAEEAFGRLRAQAEHPILALAVHRELSYARLYPLLLAARRAGWERIVLLTEAAR